MSKPDKRKCRPGYKSRSKILRSANRLQLFKTEKLRQENLLLKIVNIQLKQDFDTAKIKVEALENQMTYITNKLDKKKEAVNNANATINSLEENKTFIEDKLNSYRATLRKLIKEKEEGKIGDKVEDKGKQK